MNQIINIFRKDFRRHWYVIVLSVAILVAFAWNEPRLWVPQVPQHLGENILLSIYSGWLPPLVVIGWMILIVRVVHGESLVGDRQFWTTRPYEWKKLLIAKALFFIAFINLPLLIVQGVLLWKAGFAPTSYVKGLLWTQFLWVLVVILPMTALATVTSSFGQTVLVTLGIPLLLIGCIALSSLIPHTPHAGLLEAYSIQESLRNLVLVGTCAAVVIWQYARRRTLQSRLLLIGAAAVALGTMFIAPPQALTTLMYPQPSASRRPPVQLVFDPTRQAAKDRWPMRKDEVGIRIPLLVTGELQGSTLTVDGDVVLVEIEGPAGLRWNSGGNVYSSFQFPDQSHPDAWFVVDKGFFELVKSSSVKLHIWFALTTFRAKEVRRIVLASNEFTIPDGALCSISPEPYGSNILRCRSPLKRPFLVVTMLSEETTCPVRWAERTVPPGTIFSASQQSPGSAPAEIGFDPVKLFSLKFSPRAQTMETLFAHLCPGTPLTYRVLEESQFTRSEVTIDGIRLANYQLKDSPPSQTMIGMLH
jgi:hypothetical protein